MTRPEHVKKLLFIFHSTGQGLTVQKLAKKSPSPEKNHLCLPREQDTIDETRIGDNSHAREYA